MNKTKASKSAAKRETRLREIVECAERNFADKGFQGAGISGIAKDCGISVGHLYHYFACKEELIKAVVDKELLRQAESLSAFEDLSAENMRQAVIELVISIAFAEKDPFRTVLNFEILAEAQRNPAVAALLHEHDARIRNKFSAVLERAGFDEPCKRTELLFTVFSGLPARALRHPEQEQAGLLDLMKSVIAKILGDEPIDTGS